VKRRPFALRLAVVALSGSAASACGFVDSWHGGSSSYDVAAASDTTSETTSATTATPVAETSVGTAGSGTVSKPAGAAATTSSAGSAGNAGGAGTSSAPTDPNATASATLKANALGTLSSSGPIVVDGRSNVTITGMRVSNPNGPCIVVRNGATNVRITGNAIGPCAGHGVEILGSSSVAVVRNNLSGIGETGVKIQDSRVVQARTNFVDGAATAFRAIRSSQVEVEFNGAINVRGRYPDGQLAQFDNVTGTGNRIQCNAADLSIGGPDPRTATATAQVRTEDVINTWQSRGDPGDPILIAYNRLQGGGSFTGSGIMAGDGGGSHISVVGNRIVDPWNAGVGVAGGSDIRIERNKVFSAQPGTVAGEGFYIRNFYPSACTNIVHQNNQIKWPATDWSTAGWVQTFWQPQGECTNVTGTSTNDLNAPLTKAIFTEPIAECRARATALGLSPTGY
jgi:hypothetical protein